MVAINGLVTLTWIIKLNGKFTKLDEVFNYIGYEIIDRQYVEILFYAVQSTQEGEEPKKWLGLCFDLTWPPHLSML